MGFIQDAEIMLQAAEKANGSQALRLGWLTLAKDSISAAITESKKGVKNSDGEIPGQTSLEDYTVEAEIGEPLDLTPTDELPTIDDLPSEPEYEAMQEHQRHTAENPGLYRENCAYCGMMVALDDHDVVGHRPSTDDVIPSISDSRGKPDDDGAA